eukprot:TRINITY_DN822_c0_g1_i1.p1 TRINITY_DN822_c0_g1~~TRINITY_DN822_c0_g1_i1.p1  ORF type:complete len:705 (-),score=234.88 TRINITY_DN822_c0_g1_i1:88-2202(-)
MSEDIKNNKNNNKPKSIKVQAPKFDYNSLPKPEYIEHRIKIWEEVKKLNEEEKLKKQGKDIKITLPDGKIFDGKSYITTPMDVAKSISQGLANVVIISKVNDVLWDLNRPFEEDSSLKLLKFEDEEGKKVFWHSSAHILGQALERIYGGYLCSGPPIETGGFYYDMAIKDKEGKDVSITQEDWEKINQGVKEVVKKKDEFEMIVCPKDKALEMFKYSRFKTEILQEKVEEGGTCTIYRCGDLIDPCKGPHLPNTGKAKAFEVFQNSSAYFRKNKDNPSVQRVYAITFPSAKELKEWIENRKKQLENDHRKIGKEQELFFFDELSPGSCFFLPHGAKIYNKLMDFTRGEYRKRGFTEVITPNVFSSRLWDISGHNAKYKENMFSFICEDQEFSLKPMNCPGHCLMFRNRTRSYKELPIRLADFGVLHRNELSNALSGLTRVRRFQQDDAHIFCRREQITEEIENALGFMKHVYGVFGFEFSLELSTRPKNFMGEISQWDEAEQSLKDALNKFGKPWKLNPEDGAFYGPKIDIHVYDCMKRSFQCATIQLDFQLPIKFELQYLDENNTLVRPVIIHRAIYGSVERFFAILTEHTEGKWPFWVSPRQALVVPIGSGFNEYAEKVQKQLFEAGFYVDVDTSGKTMERKILYANEFQYNFTLVVGAVEQENNSVNVRPRGTGKDQKGRGEPMSIDDLIKHFKNLVEEYK